MRLTRVTWLYPAYLRRFYAERRVLAGRGYAEQRAAFALDGFSCGDAWAEALAPMGWSTEDHLFNALPLQRAWARERGVRWPGVGPALAVAEAQVEEARPDVLWIDDCASFDERTVERLRARCAPRCLLVGWAGAPVAGRARLAPYDLVLSNIPEYVRRLREEGLRAEHVHHAFDPRVLERLGAVATGAIPVSFVGQIVRDMHLERERLLLSLAEVTRPLVFSPSAELRPRLLASSAAKYVGAMAGRVLDRFGALALADRGPAVVSKLLRSRSRHLLPVHPRLWRSMRPAVFGLEMYRTLARSAVSLNVHAEHSPESASNMRLFEATGVGSCLLTDWKSNLPDLFRLDEEVIAFRGAQECIEKVRWLLDHPAARAEVARKGQARTLRDHTFARRALALDRVLRAALDRKRP